MMDNNTHQEQAQERDRTPITRRQFALITGAGLGSGVFSSGATAQSANRGDGAENAPPEACHGIVQSLIARMSLEEKIGQMVMPHVNVRDGVAGEEERQLIQDYKVGSFSVRGSPAPGTAAEYNNQLQEWAAETKLEVPLLMAGNMEYGAVHEIEGTTEFPLAMGMGATHSIEHAATAAQITAQEGRASGFHWAFAPVADVNTNPANPVIGTRAFGGQSGLVSEMVTAQVTTLQGGKDGGLIATPKHFPGHGDTDVDSHLGLPIATYDRETLEEVHLSPFQAAIDAGTESIMTSHIIIEAIDPDLPATLSQDVMSGLLREDMDFDGLIVTDAMSMNAITDEWGAEDAAVLAAKAGVDVINNSSHGYETDVDVIKALIETVESGELSEERVDESVRRILMAKCRRNLFADSYVNPKIAEDTSNTPEDRAKALEIANDTMTLVRNEGILPFKDNANDLTLVTGPDTAEGHVPVFGEEIVEHTAGEVNMWTASSMDPSEAEIEAATTAAEGADRVVVTTVSTGDLPSGQAALVEALVDTGKPVAAVSFGLPYDVASYPSVPAYLSSYAIRSIGGIVHPPVSAAAAVLFGEEPGGKLPVAVEEHYPFGHGLEYDE